MIFIFISIFSLISNTKDSLVFIYEPDYSLQKNGKYINISLRGGKYVSKPYTPALPFSSKRIFITGNNVFFSYKTLKEKTITARPEPFADYYGEIKEMKDFKYETPVIRVKKNNDRTTGEVQIFPFSYDGSKLTVREKILVKIKFRGKWKHPLRYLFFNHRDFLNKPHSLPLTTKHIVPPKGGIWVKIKIIKNGIYKITPAELKSIGLNPEAIDPKKIEVRNGYREVFKYNLDSLISLDTIPGLIGSKFVGNSNDKFETGEYILFYGQSLNGFKKNTFERFNDPHPDSTTNPYMDFYHNPFTDTAVYWLRTEGSPLIWSEYNGSGGSVESTYTETLHFERDLLNPARSGLGWVWQMLITPSSNSTFSDAFTAEGVASNNFVCRVGLYTPVWLYPHRVKIEINGVEKELSFNTPIYPTKERVNVSVTMNNLRNGVNYINITPNSNNEKMYIDYYEIIYEKKIEKNNMLITFPDSLNRKLILSSIGTPPIVIGIDNPYKPVEIKEDTSMENSFSYKGKRIYLAKDIYTPISLSVANPFSLWNNNADWIAITSKKLLPRAEELSEWRKQHIVGIGNPITKAITVEEIFDNFSYGVRDPSAIKRFLYYALNNWSIYPKYILLLGNGTYDYKNNFGLSQSENIVPIHTEGTAVNEYSLLSINPTYDGWFVDFNGDKKPDIPIGRVTANTDEEAYQFVQKLKGFETSSGFWRMSALILADDEHTTTSNSEIIHTQQAEGIASLLPDYFEKDKVYMIYYPFEGSEKPLAKDDFINGFNRGAIFGYFIGHGNIHQLTHEEVFMYDDINLLNNWRKTPFFYIGSCNVGYFERPQEGSIADYLVDYPGGGAIASLAATRATYPSNNYSLGQQLAIALSTYKTVGDIYYFGMNNSSGNKSYTLFGDPATPLVYDSLSGVNFNVPDTISGGDTTFIYKNTNLEDTYIIFKEPFIDSPYTSNSGNNYIYKFDGRTVYRGRYNLENKDSVGFVVPYDIKTGYGFISIFGENDERNVYKAYFPYIVNGHSLDNIPPTIQFKFNGKILKNKDKIPAEGKLSIEIEDGSGIDLRNKKNMVLFINTIENPIYFGDKFSYYSNSFTTGSAVIPYNTDANSDSVLFEVYAKDNAGNIGRNKISLYIIRGQVIWGVYNYPNPMKNKTTFIFHTTLEKPAELSIYTEYGRLVWKKEIPISNIGINYIKWDGKDFYGRKLSNGVYFYRIKISNNKFVGKVAILR